QDGTPVTSQDVKYAVERTFDRGVLSNGPSYFLNLLGGNAKTYPGPYTEVAVALCRYWPLNCRFGEIQPRNVVRKYGVSLPGSARHTARIWI
ncbi:MAG TPA: hypothetical protein VGL33_08770, partial [Streptosporangiaceae bacterium]